MSERASASRVEALEAENEALRAVAIIAHRVVGHRGVGAICEESTKAVRLLDGLDAALRALGDQRRLSSAEPLDLRSDTARQIAAALPSLADADADVPAAWIRPVHYAVLDLVLQKTLAARAEAEEQGRVEALRTAPRCTNCGGCLGGRAAAAHNRVIREERAKALEEAADDATRWLRDRATRERGAQ